jgi:hypothetical protein
MLPSSRDRIEQLPADATVLDVGGWASPLPRADWVVDLMPYETRGLYGTPEPASERFSARTWIQRDICDHDPWPFGDGEIDFAVCSHTLEDVRDPVWVCSELNRVAKAGYIEVPSRLEEQSYGVHGPWVGWSHHRWLVDVSPGEIEFVFKTAVLQGRPECQLPPELGAALTAEERVQTLFWEDRFRFGERIFIEPRELDEYLADGVARHREALAQRLGRPSIAGRLRRMLGG